MIGNVGPTPAARRARSTSRSARSTGGAWRMDLAAEPARARAFPAVPVTAWPLRPTSCSKSAIRSSVVRREMRNSSVTSCSASPRVMRPRSTASSTTSSSRSRVSTAARVRISTAWEMRSAISSGAWRAAPASSSAACSVLATAAWAVSDDAAEARGGEADARLREVPEDARPREVPACALLRDDAPLLAAVPLEVRLLEAVLFDALLFDAELREEPPLFDALLFDAELREEPPLFDAALREEPPLFDAELREELPLLRDEPPLAAPPPEEEPPDLLRDAPPDPLLLDEELRLDLGCGMSPPLSTCVTGAHAIAAGRPPVR